MSGVLARRRCHFCLIQHLVHVYDEFIKPTLHEHVERDRPSGRTSPRPRGPSSTYSLPCTGVLRFSLTLSPFQNKLRK